MSTYNTVNELNEAAAELLKNGDIKAVMELAENYGIDRDDAEDYIAGDCPELANLKMMSLGRIKLQEKSLQAYDILEDWIGYIREEIMESDNMAAAVLNGDKSIKGCLAELLKWGLKNAKPVDADILKACKISYKVTLGIPGMRTAKKLINEYYLGGVQDDSI